MPELVPRLRLSIIPNIGMLTHISLRSTARSLIPTASLPNQTASLLCSVKSPSWRKMHFLPLMCGDVTIDLKPFLSR